MNFNSNCLDSCAPVQIINLDMPVNDISNIKIYNDCNCEYDLTTLEYGYSTDYTCWSCYMKYSEALLNISELNQDFYLRIKVQGPISNVLINNEQVVYSTELAGCFEFATKLSNNIYNPYANMDNAIALNQQLAESVSQLTGIPCYYIKLKPDPNAKDIVFKEYTLLNVDSIKQLKLIILDNEMPSSKPEFSDFGLEWQTDWEVELTKKSFATAFGNTAQPLEGDLVYIPIMKRMWMVNAAFEEKKDGFMWVNTTFKLWLVKYQEKSSVELGDAQSFVDSVVKNKYEDLFGDDNYGTLSSNEEFLDAPHHPQNKLYSVFESDAVRKYVTCDTIDIIDHKLYYKGVMIADAYYHFTAQTPSSLISYQRSFCSDNISISFIIKLLHINSFSNSIINIGGITINIDQEFNKGKLYINKIPDHSIEIPTNIEMFVVIRWSKDMNICDLHAYKYSYPENIPQYILKDIHYYFDIDNVYNEAITKYNIELVSLEKANIEIHNFVGNITNFKLFDIYIDDINTLLEMYPNHQHLLINDTCRHLVNGIGTRPY